MNKLFSLIVFVEIFASPFSAESQTLGGYPVYGHLATAVHPYGCVDGYVTHFPDDSIWVNFNPNDTTTGNFNLSDIDSTGHDLLLETGFNTSYYIVSLLLSNGQYSDTHTVADLDWIPMPNAVYWKYVWPIGCGPAAATGFHYIVPLDYNSDFGLTAADTVTGIKIIYSETTSMEACDFAGAYFISLQSVSISEQIIEVLEIYPNPISDEIHITINDNYNATFILFDITSRIALRHSFINSTSINTAQLAKGIYFYEVRSKNGVIKKGRIVKD